MGDLAYARTVGPSPCGLAAGVIRAGRDALVAACMRGKRRSDGPAECWLLCLVGACSSRPHGGGSFPSEPGGSAGILTFEWAQAGLRASRSPGYGLLQKRGLLPVFPVAGEQGAAGPCVAMTSRAGWPVPCSTGPALRADGSPANSCIV